MTEELERVRAFLADEPPPSEATTAAARAALSQLMRNEDPDIAPANATPATSPLTRRPRERNRKRRSRPTWRTRAAIAVALTCVGVVIAGALGSPTATNPPSAAAAALYQLARVAANQRWTGTPGPGQYLYTKSEGLTESDTMASNRECAVKLVDHREIWIATDGTGAIRESQRDAHFTSAQDGAVCALMHIQDPATQDSSSTSRFGPGGLSFPTNHWHALSTDPAQLLVQLRRFDGGPRDPGEDFVHIGDFLRESDTPPAIRAVLYRAAALIPGVRLLGPTRDHAGRVGLGVAWFSHGHPNHELIFSQHTAALLGESYFTVSGKLDTWTVYLESKIVNSLPAAPRVR
jgi:hypothetical protein